MNAPEAHARTESIPTVLRLLIVLEEVAKLGAPVTPTEINQLLELPKPTIHRLFATLEEEGFLQRGMDGRNYAPGPRLMSLAVDVLSTHRLRTARLSVMNRLVEEIGETCNLATPERDEMLYLERVETKWPLRIRLPVGSRVPLYCTASGKLYLSSLSDAQIRGYLKRCDLLACTANTLVSPEKLRAEIERIRLSGHAEDNEEFMIGMVAVAVPVRDHRGRLLSTLSLHAPVQRMTLGRARDALPRLRVAATELSRILLDEF